MPRFRAKPVVVTAHQLTNDPAVAAELARWCGGHWSPDANADGSDELHFVIVPTPEGKALAAPGDWIVEGVNGAHRPCKDEIFRETYDPV